MRAYMVRVIHLLLFPHATLLVFRQVHMSGALGNPALALFQCFVYNRELHCPMFYLSDAALNNDSGHYEWSPKALRVFEIEHPQSGGDVAAIKAGNVSVTPLDCGFSAGVHGQALQGDVLDQSRSAVSVSAE
jgi:hypothetical protein